ncbi:MAG: hypothetical protein MUQ32_08505, partial [Chloroflexi bacterium]|nr:hypothetical protein [Chloroflexota bacterium]
VPAAGSPPPTATPTPSPTPSPTPAVEAPPVDLVVPEQLGSVVEPARATRGARGLTLNVRYPAQPGLYRLVATLHTAGGVAYDAATQALLTPVLVRVGGTMAVAYGTPGALALTVGDTKDIAVRVLNAGAVRWDQVVAVQRSRVAGDPVTAVRTTTRTPQLIATWLSVDGLDVPEPIRVQLDQEVAAPGEAADVILSLEAPAAAGSYLLIADVVAPGIGPLSAFGSAPAIIRVTVAEAPAQVPPLIPATPPRKG